MKGIASWIASWIALKTYFKALGRIMLVIQSHYVTNCERAPFSASRRSNEGLGDSRVRGFAPLNAA